MKQFIFLLFLTFTILGCSEGGPYDESADARNDIQLALTKAKAAQLPLIMVFGANWCSDCRALSAALLTGESSAKIASNFELVKINIGGFDTNLDVANDYGNPILGGIPGATLLSSDGEIVYVTKPGELSSARKNKGKALYQLFKKHLI